MADFTEAEFNEWMPVQDAVSLVQTKQGNTANYTIAKRLATDQIKARAERLFVNGKAYSKTHVLIRTDVWSVLAEQDHLSRNSFWWTGDLEVIVPDPHDYRSRGVKYELFSVRFEPAGIYKIVGQPAPLPAGKILKPAQPEDEPQRGPPVAKAALAAWYEAYKVAYTGADDTEAQALVSARGCFPGKSVSRDAVRALRGAQKRGRKDGAAR